MEILNFRTPNAVVASCGYSIEDLEDDQGRQHVMVTLTELKDNPGMSITNAYEYAASQLYRRALAPLGPERIAWFEQYEGEEWLDQVVLSYVGEGRFTSPRWTRVRS